MTLRLSIVIPAHNEEERIGETLRKYLDFFGKIYGNDYEIIVVGDGCTDGTMRIVGEFSKKHGNVRGITSEKVGKGGVIRRGFELAIGDIVGFVDADDSFDKDGIKSLIDRVGNGTDVAIASKWSKTSIRMVNEPLGRKLASRVWNIILRALLGLSIADTQAGAKFMRRDVVARILPDMRKKSGFEFDAELLWRVKQNGFYIEEVFIPSEHVSGSKFHMRQSLSMLANILKVRFGIL
jgi:dolichol-phosphate mannosyltransferase